MFDFNNDKPIYIQLAEQIEDGILKDIFLEESQIPSTTEISESYKINIATAAKGVNLLVEEGIAYKKRGVGMFVTNGAKQSIVNKRKKGFYRNYVLALVEEARKLNISKEELIGFIQEGIDNEGH